MSACLEAQQPRRVRNARGGVKAICLSAGLGLAIAVPNAAAQTAPTYPPITDRNFSIDLFEQPALGSPRLIAMSGAINSVAEGAAGLYTNPASAAVRPETRSDKLAWNVYLNSYIPADGQDSTNNGQPVTNVGAPCSAQRACCCSTETRVSLLDGGYTSHEIAPEAGGGLGVRSIIARLSLGGGLPVYTGPLKSDCDPLDCY